MERGAEIRKEIATLSSAQGGRKPSAFNYHVECDGRHMVYNAMYNTLVRMTKMEYEKLLGLRPCGKELAKLYLVHGIAVPEDLDERQCYAVWRGRQGKQSRYLSLNITTTLKCNARCAYCYEKGVVQQDFQESMLPKLIAFIKRKKKKTPVRLNWFGGEPLMNPFVGCCSTGAHGGKDRLQLLSHYQRQFADKENGTGEISAVAYAGCTGQP